MHPAIHQGEGAEVFFFGHIGFCARVLGTRLGEDSFGREWAEARVGATSGRVRRVLLRVVRFVRDEARSWPGWDDPAGGRSGVCRCPNSIRRWVVVGMLSRLVVVAA